MTSRLRSLDHALDEIKECAENRLSYEADMGHILEDLALMRGTRDDIVNTLHALDTAITSLESCGFSQEWLDCINIDGSFSECVNIDALKLVGSDDKKFEACCEGILSSIWEFLKTLWKWICDVVKKIYEFLRKFFACVSNDYDEEQRVRNLLATAVTKGKIHPGNFKDILNEINRLEGDDKFYNLAQLVDRIGVDISCGAWLTEYSIGASRPVISEVDRLLRKIGNLSTEQAGTQAIELNDKIAKIIGCKSAEDLIEDARTGDRKNYIAARLEDTIAGRGHKQPLRPFPVSNKEGTTFRAGGAKDVREIMQKNKMELINSNEGCRIELFDFAESVETIDYTEKIPTVDKFVMYVEALSMAHKELTPTLKTLIKNGQYLEVDIKSIKNFIPFLEGLHGTYSKTDDDRCAEAWKNLVVVVRSVSIQLSEIFNISTRLYSDMGRCHNTWLKFNRVIEKYLK